jgi:import inner membrane translocase subunit TIM23
MADGNGFGRTDTARAVGSSTGASSSSPNLLSQLLSQVKLGPSIPTISPGSGSQLEYLFEDEYVPNGPSWGARICYGTGGTYLVGLSTGGLWGLMDGLRNPQGAGSRRLRINCILNACTARGPFLGNSLGIIALLYNLLHGAIIKARGERHDLWTSTAAATASGLIFKSTAGAAKSVAGGALFGGTMLAYQLLQKFRQDRFYQ